MVTRDASAAVKSGTLQPACWNETRIIIHQSAQYHMVIGSKAWGKRWWGLTALSLVLQSAQYHVWSDPKLERKEAGFWAHLCSTRWRSTTQWSGGKLVRKKAGHVSQHGTLAVPGCLCPVDYLLHGWSSDGDACSCLSVSWRNAVPCQQMLPQPQLVLFKCRVKSRVWFCFLV